MRRGDFEELVRRAFDPVAGPAGFALTPQPPADHRFDGHAAAVFETTVDEFVRRLPSLARLWDFGHPPSVSCVDLWVEADLTSNEVAVSLEGWDLRQLARHLGAAREAAEFVPARSLTEALLNEAELCRLVLSAGVSG